MAFDEFTLLGVDNAGNSSEFDTYTTLLALLKAANYGQLQGFKNRLINGSFSVNQRAAATNADDTYCFDRWYVLTQTGTIACSALTNPETGAPTGIRLTQSQATAQRMGIAQIIESQNCRDLRSVVATLAGRVALSTTDDVRYAVLEWTGTADAVTSDVVNSWTNTTYTAGQFFISSNVNVLAVGEVACTAATYRDLTALNASVGASMNNLIVFVWTENAVAQNVTLDLNRVQLEPGAKATVFEKRLRQVEIAECQRYYEKSYPIATAPGGASTAGEVVHVSRAGASQWSSSFRFSTRKRTTPTVTIYSTSTGASANVRNFATAADVSVTSVNDIGETGVGYLAITAPSADQGIAFHWTAEAEL